MDRALEPADRQAGKVLLNIQALRALAAFLVVFVHLEPLVWPVGAPRDVFYFGHGGVDLFFVISGLIMVATTARPDMTAGKFMVNRITRIVPFYWTITVFVFCIALVAPMLMQATRADMSELVRSLLFIPFQKSNGFTHPVVFLGWTLNYEMAFYVLFAAGLLTGRRLLGLAITGSVLVAAVLIGVVVRPTDTLGQFYTAPLILEFALGMALGLALPAFSRARPGPLVYLAGAIAFALLVSGPLLWGQGERLFIFGLPAAVLVACALAMERGGVAVSSPLIQRLGDASYALYLTHFFVTQAVIKASSVVGIDTLWPVIATCFGTFVLVGMIGLAVHFTIEKPMSSAARRWLTTAKPAHQGARTVAP